MKVPLSRGIGACANRQAVITTRELRAAASGSAGSSGVATTAHYSRRFSPFVPTKYVLRRLAIEAMGQEGPRWAELRLERVTLLLPDLSLHDSLQPELLWQLMEDTEEVAVKLVALRRLLPSANLSRLFARQPALLLDLPIDAAAAQVQALRCALPNSSVDNLVSCEPAWLLADVEAAVGRIAEALPGGDAEAAINVCPQLVAWEGRELAHVAHVAAALPGVDLYRLLWANARWVSRLEAGAAAAQLRRLKAELPRTPVEQLIEAEPLLLVADVDALLRCVPGASRRQQAMLLTRYPSLVRWMRSAVVPGWREWLQ